MISSGTRLAGQSDEHLLLVGGSVVTESDLELAFKPPLCALLAGAESQSGGSVRNRTFAREYGSASS
jgi:hypothetical protein